MTANNSTMNTEVKFLQLNCHKTEKCMSEVSKWLLDNDNSVALCQEPAHKKGKIVSIDSSIRTYTGVPIGKNCILRTAILINQIQI